MNANYNYSPVYFSEGVSNNVFAISQMINYLGIFNVCVAFVLSESSLFKHSYFVYDILYFSISITLITYYIFPFFFVNLHLLQITYNINYN